MSRPSNKDLYLSAVELADSGQPVFPCRSTGSKAKAPLTRNGLYDASTDPAQLRSWWKKYGREASIGLPTGVLWDVLDVDSKGTVDGRAHLPRLARLGLLNGCKKVVRTPSGGWHLYFTAATGLTNKANATLGLDVRAKGGYVLAPPSYIDTDGYEGAYADEGETTDSTDAPLLWDLIVSALAPISTADNKPVPLLASERRASLAALREWVASRVSGERNNALHWAVCRCIESGLDPNELLDPAILSGLPEDEALLTIRSAIKRAGVAEGDLKTEAEAMFPSN